MRGKPQAGSGIVVQTILFGGLRVDPQAREQAFLNPMQVIHGSPFPLQFDLVILSAVHGAARGQLGCTHRLRVDGEEVFRFEHALAPVPLDQSGLSFRLELQAIQVPKPCTILVETTLSTGDRGQDVPLRVVDRSALGKEGAWKA